MTQQSVSPAETFPGTAAHQSEALHMNPTPKEGALTARGWLRGERPHLGHIQRHAMATATGFPLPHRGWTTKQWYLRASYGRRCIVRRVARCVRIGAISRSNMHSPER